MSLSKNLAIISIVLEDWLKYYLIYVIGFYYLFFHVAPIIGLLYWGLFFITDQKFRIEHYKRVLRKSTKSILDGAMTVEQFEKNWKWGAQK